MKVFVITNSSINNYGAILQAFALQKKLVELGADSYVLRKVDPPRSKLQKVKAFFTPKEHYTLKDNLHIRKSRKQYSKKKAKLNLFYSSNIKSKVCHSLEEATILTSGVDAMIAGSDQIWSPTAHMLSDFTTLQFGGDYIRRYSYAASVGATYYDSASEQTLREGLKRFSSISVRESSTVHLVSSLTEKQVHQNIDPTLLYDESFWNNYVSERIIEKPYVFVYMLRPEPLTLNVAKHVASKMGKDLYVISNRIIEGVNNITDAGLEDWLSYIKYADYVVTNSFHGTAFSVLFKKRFLSVSIAGSGMRVSDLLDSVDLSDRIIESENDLSKIYQSIDWEHVETYLDRYRKDATNYLKEIVVTQEPQRDDKVRLFHSKGECCACGACYNICPKSAISMRTDDDGYIYPEIDTKKCVNCGLCKKVCAYQNGLPEAELIGAYAAVTKDNDLLKKSASGGLFASIARNFLQENSAVVGCAYRPDANGLHPQHIIIERVEELPLLQSSKYAQSDIDSTYKEVKRILENGKRVLFSGTSCQVSGLRGFLQDRDYDNLYTIDIICHGVPSDRIFQSYLKMIEKKKRIHICDINFRDKKYGWGEKGTIGYVRMRRVGRESTDGERRELRILPSNSSYYKLYLLGALYRENCYTCPFTDWKRRPGDITIGDFWGIKNQHPELLMSNGGPWDDQKGISCLLVNTEKGKQLIRDYGTELDIKTSNIDKITERNKMLLRPTYYYQDRSNLLKIFRDEGYEGIEKWFWRKYGLKIWTQNLYRKIPVGIRVKAKETIKKFIH